MMDIEIVESSTDEGYTELNYRPRRPLILVVGSNPSSDSPDASAFHADTKSGRKVRSWLHECDADVHYTNVYDQKTLANRPLTKKEIMANVPTLIAEIHLIKPDGIVAVGNAAQEALDHAGAEYFGIAHPSGLSRFWNSKEDSERALEALRDYISGV